MQAAPIHESPSLETDGKGHARLLARPEKRLRRDGEPVLRARNEAVNLERKLSDLVNGAYGLTDEESNLLFARPLRPRTPHHSLLPQASSHAIR